MTTEWIGPAMCLLAASSFGQNVPRIPLSDANASAHSSTIARDGDSMYCAWTQDGSTIHVDVSHDGGATWLPSSIEVPGSAATLSATGPRIAVQGSKVYLAWQHWDIGLFPDVMFSCSHDAGATWQPAVRINHSGAGTTASLHMELAASGDTVHVAWVDTVGGTGPTDVYVNRSTDGGLTWQPTDTRLDSGCVACANSLSLDIAVDGATVCVAWHDARNGASDIYCNTSLDGGVTWQATDTRLDTDTAGAHESVFPTVVVDGTLLAVAWSEQSGQLGVYANVSNDLGVTWKPTMTRLSGPGTTSPTFQPCGAVTSSRLMFAWAEDLEFVVTSSADSGATWQTTPTRLDSGTGLAITACDLQAAGSTVAATWLEVTDPEPTESMSSVRCNYSLDAGVTWQNAEVRISPLDTMAPGPPRLAITESSIDATWNDSPRVWLSSLLPLLCDAAPPTADGPASTSAPFTISCAASRYGCLGAPVILLGPPAASPIDLAGLGCSSPCTLRTTSAFGSFPSPLLVPSGLPIGLALSAQCGCIGEPPGGTLCVHVSAELALTIGP